MHYSFTATLCVPVSSSLSFNVDNGVVLNRQSRLIWHSLDQYRVISLRITAISTTTGQLWIERHCWKCVLYSICWNCNPWKI